MTHPDDCAFPIGVDSGLTKREYFAALAMQGLLCASRILVAADAVQQADALIAELNK